MTIVMLSLFAAAGLLIGWAAGSAVAASRLRRRRETESMNRYNDLVRVLSRTARTSKGDL
jgi:hypothetical protein